MFDATRGGLHESFLDGTVQIAIGGHVAEPTVSEDSGKQLAHTGCLSLSLSLPVKTFIFEHIPCLQTKGSLINLYTVI